MIRTTITAIASAASLLAAGELLGPQVVQADTVRGALCELTRANTSIPTEEFRCDFSQFQGNAYIDSDRWAFKFPYAEQGKTFRRQATVDFLRFYRDGQYILTIYQSGEKPKP